MTIRNKRKDVIVELRHKFNSIDLPDDSAVYRYVIAANIRRRHLSAEDKRMIIADLLKLQPETSDRAIAKSVKVDNKTVAAVRSDMERREEIPHVETRTDSKGRKQPTTRKSDDPELAALRERAAQHGLRIRKRGAGWVTIDADGKSTGSSESLDVLNVTFDATEGKIAWQMYTHCGMRIEGANNSKVWLAAHPGATVDDFERALPPAPNGCDLNDDEAPQPKPLFDYDPKNDPENNSAIDRPEDIWRRGLMFRASESAAMATYKYWEKEYGNWHKFDVPDEALSLAMEAAKAWAELVNVLKAQRTVADLRKAAA